MPPALTPQPPSHHLFSEVGERGSERGGVLPEVTQRLGGLSEPPSGSPQIPEEGPQLVS